MFNTRLFDRHLKALKHADEMIRLCQRLAAPIECCIFCLKSSLEIFKTRSIRPLIDRDKPQWRLDSSYEQCFYESRTLVEQLRPGSLAGIMLKELINSIRMHIKFPDDVNHFVSTVGARHSTQIDLAQYLDCIWISFNQASLGMARPYIKIDCISSSRAALRQAATHKPSAP